MQVALRLKPNYPTSFLLIALAAEGPEAKRVYVGSPCEVSDESASLVSSLVLETDGTLAPRWRTDVYLAFRKLCEGVCTGQSAASAPPVFNWYEAVAQAASLR